MTAALIVAGALGVAAAFEDLRSRSVPNWLTAGGAVCGVVLASVSGSHALLRCLGGMAAGFLILLPFYGRRAMGGGDVKLMAAFGSLMSPQGALLAAFFAAIAGAAIAATVLFCRPRARAIPYAPAIVLGAWITILGGAV